MATHALKVSPHRITREDVAVMATQFTQTLIASRIPQANLVTPISGNKLSSRIKRDVAKSSQTAVDYAQLLACAEITRDQPAIAAVNV
ncbi:MAG: hypothetical protein NT013_03345 [Planctomycetia bacterium]|nr:hypothetical protein [Planctomycetia bacterium]